MEKVKTEKDKMLHEVINAVLSKAVLSRAVLARAVFSRVTSALLAVALMSAAPARMTQAAADKDANWYQIDVIVFAPTDANANASNEAWPDMRPEFPADIVSITGAGGPRPFLLSHLQELQGFNMKMEATSAEPELPDAFSFEQESQASQHRRRMQLRFGDPDAIGDEDAFDDEADDPPLNERSFDEESLDEASEDGAASGSEFAESNNSGNREVEARELDLLLTGEFDDMPFQSTQKSSLTDIMRRLRRSPNFNMLTHHSWVQPVTDQRTPILIQTGERYGDLYEIEGTLSFYRGRYLHVETNLWYTLFQRTQAAVRPLSLTRDLPQALMDANSDLLEVESRRGQFVPSARHRMKQSRRLRMDELHYLDHPLMGVIVRVNRHE